VRYVALLLWTRSCDHQHPTSINWDRGEAYDTARKSELSSCDCDEEGTMMLKCCGQLVNLSDMHSEVSGCTRRLMMQMGSWEFMCLCRNSSFLSFLNQDA